MRSKAGTARIRVVFKDDSRFHGPTTNGKYALDVTDLRNAFLFANTVAEKIAAFRSERVIAISNGQTLAPLAEGPKLVMHCIPYESFGAKPQFDVFALERIALMLPNHLSGYGMNVNFEGRICISFETRPKTYTQLFRNGVIEAVRAGILKNSQGDAIPSLAYEEALITYLPHCFDILKS